MTGRQRLPNRRRQETVELQYGQHDYLVSVGFDANGAIREVFVAGQKQGSTLDALAQLANLAQAGTARLRR